MLTQQNTVERTFPLASTVNLTTALLCIIHQSSYLNQPYSSVNFCTCWKRLTRSWYDGTSTELHVSTCGPSCGQYMYFLQGKCFVLHFLTPNTYRLFLTSSLPFHHLEKLLTCSWHSEKIILVFPVFLFVFILLCVCIYPFQQKAVLLLHKAHKGMRSYSG